jgi:arsenate reductase
MNIKVYTLSTCSTSKKILKELQLNNENAVIQDIKFNPISRIQLNELVALAGSYSALFSKRAIKYKEVKPAEGELTENEIQQLLLKEYTFLKRPVFVINNQLFIGNGKANIQAAKQALKK